MDTPWPLRARLENRLDRADLPAPLRLQAGAVLEKLAAIQRRHPLWPVPELPRRAAMALGLSDDLAEGLAAAAVLFYAASDLIDDAQDDELATHPTWPGWDWRHAVNAGNLLLFLSGEEVAALDAPAEARAALAAEFAHAGARLARGQFKDFLATPEAPWGEAELLGVLQDKAGASFSCFAALAALGAGEDPTPWRAVGEPLGMALQLASDLRPYHGFGVHPDLAVGKLTLPLLYARDADPSLASSWADGPLGHLAQEGLKARVARTGAITFARMRVEVLKKEAFDRLAAIAHPEARAALRPLVEAVVAWPEPVPAPNAEEPPVP